MSFRGSTFGTYSGRWLVFVGFIELAIAGVFVFLALSLPALAAFGMWLTAAILAVTGVVLVLVGLRVRQSAEAVDDILSTGVAGTAYVTGVAQTGMYLNGQPQLELDLQVSVPGRAGYAARHKSFVPMILLGRVTSGQPLPVRIDNADPQRVVIDWQNAGFGPTQPLGPKQPVMAAETASSQQTASPPTAAAIDETRGMVPAAVAATPPGTAPVIPNQDPGAYTVDQLRTWLRQHGEAATARVDTLDDSGQLVGDERLYTTEMTLMIPGQAPRKLARSTAMVPAGVSHRLFQGMTVPVRYAAENPDLLMVEWDKL